MKGDKQVAGLVVGRLLGSLEMVLACWAERALHFSETEFSLG